MLHTVLLLLLLLPKPPLSLPAASSLLYNLAFLNEIFNLSPSDLLHVIGPSWTGPALAALLYLVVSLGSLALVLLYSLAPRASLLLLLPAVLVKLNLCLANVCVMTALLHSPSPQSSYLAHYSLSAVLLLLEAATLAPLAAEIHRASAPPGPEPALLAVHYRGNHSTPYSGHYGAPCSDHYSTPYSVPYTAPSSPPFSPYTSYMRFSSPLSSFSSTENIALTQDHFTLAPLPLAPLPLAPRLPCPPPGPYTRPASIPGDRCSYTTVRAPLVHSTSSYL
jgi:hypothetical protein